MTKQGEVGPCSMDEDPISKALVAYLLEHNQKNEV